MSSQSEKNSSGEEFHLYSRRKTKKNKRRSGRPTFMSNWVLETKFPNEQSAVDKLTEEDIWTVDPQRRYATQAGRKVHYRCNRLKDNGLPCPILKCLYFPNKSEEVWLYKTETEHNHDKNTPRPNAGDEFSSVSRRRKKKKKTKTKGRPTFMANWVLECKFPDEQSAVDKLKEEEIWTVDPQRRYRTQTGRKVHYRCNRIKKNGKPCSILKCLYFPNNSNEVCLYKTDNKHSHNKTTPLAPRRYRRRHKTNRNMQLQFSQPLDNNLKFRIINLQKQMKSPREIMLQLESEGFEVKNRQIQIRNFCARLRTDKITSSRTNTSVAKLEKVFNGLHEVKMYLKQEKMWNYKFQNDSRNGMTYHYRCKLVPKDGPQCAAGKYFRYNQYTNEAKLYQKDCPHTHTEILRSSNLNLEIRTNWLLKQLHKCDRNTLIERGFRVMKAVGVEDCLANPTDYSTSFHEQLLMLQQESYDDHVKEEILTDDENFIIPLEVNLYEGQEDLKKPLSSYRKRTRKPLFTSEWLFEQKFPNEQLAIEYLAKDEIWHIDPRRVYPITGGRKVHYRCNRMKINGPQCGAWKCLLYTVDSDEVSLYKTNSEHTHDTIAIQYRKSYTSIKRRMLKQRRKLQQNSGNCEPEITPKRGRPFKLQQTTVIKNESIIKDEDNLNLSVSDNNDAHISNDSHSNSMEFITGDDSVQYVINYISDDQTSNAEDTSLANQYAELTSSDCNWWCEKSFATIQEAKACLKNSEWSCVFNTIFNGQRKTYYRCNMVKKTGIQCAARAFLLCNEKPNSILFYRNHDEHTHDQQISAGLALPNPYRKNIQQTLLEVPPLLIPLHSENSTELITCDDTSSNQFLETEFEKYDHPNSKWKLVDKISSKDMISSYLNKQNTWRCKYRSRKTSKVLYSCTTAKCDAQMSLINDRLSNGISVYRNGEHNHSIGDEITNLLIPYNANDIIPDTYFNSNIIMKEELIIEDEPMIVIQNESDVMDADISINDDEQMAYAQKWNFEKKFVNMDEANAFLAASNGLWQIKSTTDRKLFYSCTYPCETQCPAHIYFLFQSNCDEVMYFSGDQHIHPLVNETVINSQTIEEIFNLDSDTEEPIAGPSTAVEISSDTEDPKAESSTAVEISRNTEEPKAGSSTAVNISNVNTKTRFENPAPKLNEFTFRGKFPNITEARKKLIQENDCFVSTCCRRYAHEYRQYYWCNYGNAIGNCNCRVILLGSNETDEVLYYSSGVHTHDVNTNKSKPTEIIKPTQSLECTEEIVILDDSDKDSLNGDHVENNRDEWTFETKFDDYKTAKHYMKNLNLLSFKSNISKYGVKEYFNCNLVSDDDHCPASKYLLYEDANSAILMYNRDIQHASVCTNVIPPLVPVQKRSANVIELVDSDDNETDNNPNVIMLIESDEEDYMPPSYQDIMSNGETTWIMEKEFKTSQEAIEYMNNQLIFSVKVRNKSKEDIKEIYRCNLVKKKGLECAANKLLHIKCATNVATVYTTELNHTHDLGTRAAQAYQHFETFDDDVKDKIHELIMVGSTPKLIIDKLAIQDSTLEKHLHYYISRMRRHLLLKGKISTTLPFIKTVENWLSQITAVPENEDAHYCVSFNVDHLNKAFRCFLSTRRLLKNAVGASLIHLDSTCGLTWQYNPVTLIGTTDLDQKFHLFGIAISTNKNECDYEFMFKSIQKGVQECHNKIFKPECLISDDNELIRTAFIKRYGILSKIGVCSKLALSKIFYKLSTLSISDVLKNSIQEDIHKMQQLSSSNLFFKAAELFFKKWLSESSEKLIEFLKYFKMNWIDKNSYWFQGFRQYTPHTNAAIRNEYELLKKKYTFNRQNNRKEIDSFRYRIQIELEELSRQCITTPYAHKTTIPLSVYEKAIIWNNLEKQIEIVPGESETLYYILPGNEKVIDEEKLMKYRKCEHQTLDEFLDIQFSFWCVRRVNNSPTLTCTCPNFLENFVCEHSVGMASVLNMIKFPQRFDLTNYC